MDDAPIKLRRGPGRPFAAQHPGRYGAVRDAYLQHIADTGIVPTLRELAARSGVPFGGSLKHYVNRLIKDGWLVEYGEGRYRRIAPAGAVDALRDWARQRKELEAVQL